MILQEFEEWGRKQPCFSCHQTGCLELVHPAASSPHYAYVACSLCNARQVHMGWISKPRTEKVHPRFHSGDVQAAWDAGGNCCAFCGLHERDLAFLGLGKTGQHCPPCSSESGAKYIIPLCSWCQQESTSRLIRMTALVKRLRGHDA